MNFPIKFRLLAHSWSFLANQKARNAIVGAENLLNENIPMRHLPVAVYFGVEVITCNIENCIKIPINTRGDYFESSFVYIFPATHDAC